MLQYEQLALLDFTSKRKRMSVVVRAPNEEEAGYLLAEGARQAVHAKGALAEVMLREVLAEVVAKK